MTIPLLDLMRRIDSALAGGEPLKATADDVRLMAELGVVEALSVAAQDERSAADLPPIWPDPHEPTSVYFLRCGPAGPVKIGLTNDVQKRVKNLQTASPLELEVLAAMPAAAWHEQRLHGFFRAERIHGEWFRPSPRLLAYIERVKSIP